MAGLSPCCDFEEPLGSLDLVFLHTLAAGEVKYAEVVLRLHLPGLRFFADRTERRSVVLFRVGSGRISPAALGLKSGGSERGLFVGLRVLVINAVAGRVILGTSEACCDGIQSHPRSFIWGHIRGRFHGIFHGPVIFC